MEIAERQYLFGAYTQEVASHAGTSDPPSHKGVSSRHPGTLPDHQLEDGRVPRVPQALPCHRPGCNDSGSDGREEKADRAEERLEHALEEQVDYLMRFVGTWEWVPAYPRDKSGKKRAAPEEEPQEDDAA